MSSEGAQAQARGCATRANCRERGLISAFLQGGRQCLGGGIDGIGVSRRRGSVRLRSARAHDPGHPVTAGISGDRACGLGAVLRRLDASTPDLERIPAGGRRRLRLSGELLVRGSQCSRWGQKTFHFQGRLHVRTFHHFVLRPPKSLAAWGRDFSLPSVKGK